MSAYSDALYRVTYAYGITFAAHAIKIATLGSGGYKWDNKLGRNNLSKDLSKVPEAILARAKRADAAHQNGYESLVLFAPAVVTAIYAGVDPSDVDKFSKLYLLFRVIYTVVFIFGGDGSDLIATLRTGVWVGSVYSSVTLILRAANLLAAKKL